MTNPIFRAYQALDATIMKGVNAGVKAWNWTTGDTKVDLANKLLTIAPIPETVGFYGLLNYVSLITAPMSFILSHFKHKVNERVDVLERESLENGLIHPYVENKKKGYSFDGPMYAIPSSANFMSSNLSEDSIYHIMLGLGLGLRSLSEYLMRADSFPPKKDCVSRGIERIVEAYHSHKEQVAMVPELARARSGLF